MSRPRRSAAILLAALAGCLALTSPAGAAGPAGSGHVARSGNLPTALLTSISCTGAGNCWAVGLTTGGRARPVIDRWNGSAWAFVPAPVPRTALALWSVSCASGAFCWAVGTDGPNGARPFAERWNGTKWSPVPLPAFPGRSLAVSDDVWCSGAASCWVLEDGGPAEFEHWNGRAWAVVAVPAFGPGDLFDRVTCASAHDCWVTGRHGTAGTISGRWNGSRWRAVPVPAPTGSSSALLLAVDCIARTDCWAVGADSHGQAEPSLFEHWNGTAWSIAN